MTERMLKVLPLGVFGALLATLAVTNTAPAQPPIPLVNPGTAWGQPDPVPLPLPVPGQPGRPQPGQPAPAGPGDGVEVLAKGPVHEAFASTAEAPTAAPVVAKPPPDPIEELPPDQKPAGDNVQWIPGYWSWDDEGGQYIWVSGFWRQPPPGRVWVAGSWREVRGGWQYVPGFWQEVAPPAPQQALQPQAQPEIEYLPQPPATLELGPTVAAPGATSVYVPGSWVWRGRYVWRPGVWVEYRANWLWVPARYHWTPAGYVFCDGYWDYPLAARGVLFAPVVFTRPVYARPAFVYTPVYVVSEPCMTGALFVRRGCGSYYFGDYFDARYVSGGYSAWCGTVTRGGFSVGFGVGRTWGYDPLWSYYSVHYRDTPRWHGGVADVYAGRYRGDVARPPVTLVQQNTVINRITQTNVTNVTNNITVVNGAATVGTHNVANVAMVAPLKVAPDLQRTKFEPVAAERRREEATAARQLRDVGVQRTKLETAAAAKPQPVAAPGGAAQPAVQPQTIKLDVPKAAVARARVASDDKAPPPNPLRAANTGAGAKAEPKLSVAPKVEPKVNPPAVPATNPTPKAPGNPTVGPAVVPTPKVEPKAPGNPAVMPKVDPKLPANPGPPPATPQPKADPRPPTVAPTTPVAPKVNPPGPTAPVAPAVMPKVNPPGATAPTPKVEPPKVAPQPVPTRPADPRPAVVPPATPQPKVEPRPVTMPSAPGTSPVGPRVEPPKGNPSGPAAQPKLPPTGPTAPARPTGPAPKVEPKSPPPPVAAAPPAAPHTVTTAPVTPARPQPAPAAQPRPAAVSPAAPPTKSAQPPAPKPPATQSHPAPVGKPPVKKSRDE